MGKSKRESLIASLLLVVPLLILNAANKAERSTVSLRGTDTKSQVWTSGDTGNKNASWKDRAQTVQAMATAIALIVAGFWTYLLFVQNREQAPKADMEHTFTRITLDSDRALLRVAAKVTNTGKVLFLAGDVTARVQQIIPLASLEQCRRPECPSQLLSKTGNVRPDGKSIAQWPLLDSYKGAPHFEMEPGESENLVFDLVIPISSSVVQVYTVLENRSKPGVGWETYSVVDFRGAQ